MISKQALAKLLGAVVLLPVAIVLTLALGALLRAMQDPAGAAVLARVGLALGVAWVFALVCLVLALAANVIEKEEGGAGKEDGGERKEEGGRRKEE